MECEIKENEKILIYILLNGCKPKKTQYIHKWKEQNISQQQQKQGNAN